MLTGTFGRVINKRSFQLCFTSLSGLISGELGARQSASQTRRRVVRHTAVELQPPVESRTSPTWGPSVLLYCTRHKTAGGVALSQAQACDSHRSPSSVTGFCSIVLHVSFYCRTRLSSGLTRRQEKIQRKMAVDVANKFGIPLHQKVFRISATLCGTSLAK